MLLAIFVASSASPIPTDVGEDYSDIGFLSYPDESLVIYRVAQDDIIEAEELRHLEKRSPLVPFPFPLAKKKFKKPLKKKPKKVFLKPKLLKKSPFIKKGIKKGGPPLLLAGAGLSAPSIPAIGLGGAGAGAAGLGAFALGGGFGGGN